jgi:hypothetical protein
MTEIKKPKWEACPNDPSITQNWPTKNPLNPNSFAEVGMHVFGYLNGKLINLVVTEVLNAESYDKAEYNTTVFGDFTEENLENGNPVWIDRKHICNMSSDK